ncbi:hypothetical protein JQX13_14410 [Archangium violaceum]|uniref:hypothetical protein n=1 Tax=Archangium violaceum TaxID=83451 RepID=UPI00193B30DB|nr:hypothetical protein [Archangium violaceum]QRK11155.1 hypothetical protein JQX13_14410 [Archangium violaceum]
MEEVIIVSLIGLVVFGGLFLLLCPEWWSTSLGTLKEKKPAGDKPAAKTPTEKTPEAPEAGANQKTR